MAPRTGRSEMSSGGRIVPLELRYRGFDCPDLFVVGYGLDYEERFRNVPDILAVHDLDALREDPDRLLPYLPRTTSRSLGGPAGD